MNIETEKIGDNILLLTFDTRYEMGMTFVRLQEYYESPEFKGKYFSLEEFIDYWCKNSIAFDYPVRWRGYNLPSQSIQEWYTRFVLCRGDIREKENILLNTIFTELDFNTNEWKDFYVIAVSKTESEEDRKNVIDHELSHALYTLSPEYREKCDSILENEFGDDEGGKIKRYLELCLSQKGYHEDVFEDETVAYLATGNIKDIGIDKETANHKGIKALRDNFKMFKTG
jgi:hypothetical protein